MTDESLSGNVGGGKKKEEKNLQFAGNYGKIRYKLDFGKEHFIPLRGMKYPMSNKNVVLDTWEHKALMQQRKLIELSYENIFGDALFEFFNQLWKINAENSMSKDAIKLYPNHHVLVEFHGHYAKFQDGSEDPPNSWHTSNDLVMRIRFDNNLDYWSKFKPYWFYKIHNYPWSKPWMFFYDVDANTLGLTAKQQAQYIPPADVVFRRARRALRSVAEFVGFSSVEYLDWISSDDESNGVSEIKIEEISDMEQDEEDYDYEEGETDSGTPFRRHSDGWTTYGLPKSTTSTKKASAKKGLNPGRRVLPGSDRRKLTESIHSESLLEQQAEISGAGGTTNSRPNLFFDRLFEVHHAEVQQIESMLGEKLRELYAAEETEQRKETNPFARTLNEQDASDEKPSNSREQDDIDAKRYVHDTFEYHLMRRKQKWFQDNVDKRKRQKYGADAEKRPFLESDGADGVPRSRAPLYPEDAFFEELSLEEQEVVNDILEEQAIEDGFIQEMELPEEHFLERAAKRAAKGKAKGQEMEKPKSLRRLAVEKIATKALLDLKEKDFDKYLTLEGRGRRRLGEIKSYSGCNDFHDWQAGALYAMQAGFKSLLSDHSSPKSISTYWDNLSKFVFGKTSIPNDEDDPLDTVFLYVNLYPPGTTQFPDLHPGPLSWRDRVVVIILSVFFIICSMISLCCFVSFRKMLFDIESDSYSESEIPKLGKAPIVAGQLGQPEIEMKFPVDHVGSKDFFAPEELEEEGSDVQDNFSMDSLESDSNDSPSGTSSKKTSKESKTTKTSETITEESTVKKQEIVAPVQQPSVSPPPVKKEEPRVIHIRQVLTTTTKTTTATSYTNSSQCQQQWV